MSDLKNAVNNFVEAISDAIVRSVKSKIEGEPDFNADFEESPEIEDKPEPEKSSKKLGNKKRDKKAKGKSAPKKPKKIEEPEVEENADLEDVTSDDVLMLMHKVTNKSGLKTVIGIMKKFGANKQSELDSDDYPAVVEALEAEL